MSRFRSVSTEEIASLADSLDLTFAAEETVGAADRIDALSDIYKSLEDAPDGGLTGTWDGRDYFDARPFRP